MLPSIFLYIDYRQYLDNVFLNLRKTERGFSYRNFAKLANSSSPNLLQLIKARKLNLSSSQLAALAKSLKLNKKQERYFETIVGFDHAKNHSEKNKYFQRIFLNREYQLVKTINKKHYEYFSQWYNPVIREMVTIPEYNDDPGWIAERIVPQISAHKVKMGIELLESLKLISRNSDNTRWILRDSTISTPSQVLSMAVVKYHQDIITIARDAIERFNSNQRDIRSVTLSLNSEGFKELKKRMEAFWKEILLFADSQDEKDQVFQANMQLFPLSIIKKDSK